MITIVITSNILTLYFTISNEMGGYVNQKHENCGLQKKLQILTQLFSSTGTKL